MTVHPLTPERWDDLVDLFGPERGANSGCWCMWWRMTRADWKAAPREEKRDCFRSIVKEGPPPGVLAYEGDIAVGWCAVGPRKTLPQFNRSRVASPIEDIEGVFAVNCFYVRAGLARAEAHATATRGSGEVRRLTGCCRHRGVPDRHAT